MDHNTTMPHSTLSGRPPLDAAWELSAALRESALNLVATMCNAAMKHAFDDTSNPGSISATSLLLAMAADALQEDAYGDRAIELMDTALGRLDLDNIALFGGATGLVWTALEVDAVLGINEYALLANDFDDTLNERLSTQRRWPGHYELINGLTSVGVYAYTRRLEGHGGQLVEHVVNHLSNMATRLDDGCCWITTRSMTAPGWHWPAAAGDSLIDLGIAHGNAGVIALLSAVVEQQPGMDLARSLLEAVLSWYMAQRRPDAGQGVFGYKVGDPQATRGAWCYGDFSAAWALLSAADALQDARLERFGIDLLRQASARTHESLQLTDPWLCHGHAGLSHLLRRVALRHRDEDLMAVSQQYFAAAIELCQAPPYHAHHPWSLLEGMVGNCLSYLDFCGLSRRRWDRLLLVN